MPAHDLEEEWEHHRYAVRDLDTLATLAVASTAVDNEVIDVETTLPSAVEELHRRREQQRQG